MVKPALQELSRRILAEVNPVIRPWVKELLEEVNEVDSIIDSPEEAEKKKESSADIPQISPPLSRQNAEDGEGTQGSGTKSNASPDAIVRMLEAFDDLNLSCRVGAPKTDGEKVFMMNGHPLSRNLLPAYLRKAMQICFQGERMGAGAAAFQRGIEKIFKWYQSLPYQDYSDVMALLDAYRLSGMKGFKPTLIFSMFWFMNEYHELDAREWSKYVNISPDNREAVILEHFCIPKEILKRHHADLMRQAFNTKKEQ